ncbi:phosphohydrolase [Beijerinckia indica]|uniref:Metal dependent phosphohydrolase, HD region n=1 Tax=Beijerinckia indica subsp. indica (strain ATCC 9039 / DSM 1715 / NCIMB 8712) TaxID=395963 RepID=B2IJ53_BEII9|nr:phosphohydrolase [Beijerinckia indica]ACB94816.1 metal dependent phosphohydrolase, HD region [Beijerinckia indica subsp. indica ATCC 9039]
MTTSRAWVRLPSGMRLDLLNPTPFDWQDEDLALGLARTYRWGGHSAWPLPLSVAQHSLMVVALRRLRFPKANRPRADLRELLHDADEGLLGFDCISVIKPFLGQGYAILTERLKTAVFLRYGLSEWTPRALAAHKRADRIAAASEAVHVVGWSPREVRSTLHIPFAPLQEDPLQGIYGGTAWEPWPPNVAAERFLAELKRLSAQAGTRKRRVPERLHTTGHDR